MPWLLVAALCMPLVGCSSDDDDDEPEQQKVVKTYTYDYFKQEGRYLIGYPDLKASCWLVWGNKGTSFSVYMVQNGRIYDAGLVHSNDTILTEEERNSKSLAFDVEIPTAIDKDGDIGVIALCDVESSLSGGNIECKADLRRTGAIPTWDNSQLSSLETDGKSYALMTIENVNVRNTTSDTITVRHMGFDAKEKWYYSKAKVVLTADMKVNGYGSSVGEEVFSKTYTVAPGDVAKIWSFYVPTGKKMKDARLVMEINGKEVKTQPISSDLDIEFRQYYQMQLEWDGKSLKWKLNSKETRGFEGKDMFSNDDIIESEANGSDSSHY